MKRLARFFYYLFQLDRLPSRDAFIEGVKQWTIGLTCCAVFWLMSALMLMHTMDLSFAKACKTVVERRPVIDSIYAVVLGFFLCCMAVAAVVCAIAAIVLFVVLLAFFAVGCWMFGGWLVRDSKRDIAALLKHISNAFKRAWSRSCGATT